MVPYSTENKLSKLVASAMKALGLVVVVLLLADLAVVNFKVFSPQKLSPPSSSLLTPSPTLMPTVYPEVTEGPVASPSVTSLSPTLPPKSAVTGGPMVKEIYIPLGNGSTKSLDWTGIPGAEVVLDAANFSKIKSTIFEAFLQILTGNGKVYAKLYNVSDKHDVWSSEVVVEGGGIQRMESKNIVLDAGRKVYRVMMKTTMGYEAVLESARLKIILE